jgi:cell division protein ZapE
MPDGATGTLRDRYQAELAARGFRSDAAQLRAIDRLDKLRRALLRADRADRAPARVLWRRVTGQRRAAAPRGVYLWGGVGRGKTWLMDIFFQSLPLEQKRRSHFHRFMHDVHAELRAHRDTPDPLALVAARLAGRARILCFDELYVSDIADAMLLGGLFHQLIDHGVALVFTSNVPPSGLYRDGLQRQRFLPAIELLERELDIVAVDGGTDYRLRQLTQAPIYVDSVDPACRQRLGELFDELADGEIYSDPTIEIEGRAIAVVRESDNVVWFEFAAICDGPRSQNDYIEIAREYQSVIISGVPQFDASCDDSARRFIALVDEFYDRGVKLVLSAAAPPNELYRGERLRFEFARTASRLIEMQSAEYLAREHQA